MTAATPRTREQRTELLAQTDPDALVALADRCLADQPPPSMIQKPEVGMVMLTVREPVEAARFYLGEVLVTRSEVEHRGAKGWAMRMGDDPLAALAAAVLDAEHEAHGPCSPAIEELCDLTASHLARTAAREWESIRPTVVDFEEMD